MSREIRIDEDVVLAHARKVDRVADGIDEALSAARSSDVGDGAFGVLCAWMVPPAQVASAVVEAQMRELQSALQRTSSELRGLAADFDDHEVASVQAFVQLGDLG